MPDATPLPGGLARIARGSWCGMEGNSDLDTRPGKRIFDGDELFSDLPECERRALLNDVIWSDPLKLYAGALPGDRPAYAIYWIVSRQSHAEMIECFMERGSLYLPHKVYSLEGQRPRTCGR